MPGRSRKSKAAGQREQVKRKIDDEKQVKFTRSLGDEASQETQSQPDRKVLSGTLHQGDNCFHYPGIQCTYISFWALLSMKIKSPHLWNANDVDSCVITGNERFIEYCCDQKWQPKMLLVRELPHFVRVCKDVFECHQSDTNILVGTLSQKTNAVEHSFSICDAVVKGLGHSGSCLLVCGGQTIALTRHSNNFYIFDPHSRDRNGFLHQSGSAVLVSFTKMSCVLGFIERLFIHSLRLKSSEQFEIVPMKFSKFNNSKYETDQPCVYQTTEVFDSKSSDACAEKCQNDLPGNRKQEIKTLHNKAMESYFEDQKQRDRAFKEKRTREKIFDTSYNSARKEYMRQYMQRRRDNDTLRKHDNSVARTGMTKIRNTAEGKEKNKERAVKGMKMIRETAQGKQKNKERASEGMKKIRDTKDGKQKNIKSAAEGMKKIRDTAEGKRNNRERAMEGMRKRLSSRECREKHNKRSAEGMKKILKTDEGRQKHNIRSAKGMNDLRRKDDYVEKERVLKKKRKLDHSLSDAVQKFNDSTYCSCSYVCSCCHQVWFKQSVKQISSINKLSPDAKSLLNKCMSSYMSVGNNEWICNTCLSNIKQGKIPKLSVMNGMKFPHKPPELNLGNLEERLISLRIPFMQIRALNSGGQFSLKGSVVNVPTEIEPTIRALPRLENQSETIPVKLKRMKEFKHAVVTENVRPHAVMTALRTLLDTSALYKEANISVDEEWEPQRSAVDIANDSSNVQYKSDNESDTFSETDEDDNAPLMTLLDERSIDKNEILSVAPGEGQKPISVFKDPHAEYLAFPTIFCGQKRPENSERHTPVYYSDICKWELRSVDRRAALHIPNIFFKMKKLQTQQVCSKVHLAVRRCKTKGKSYTAGYILKDNMGESLVRLDEGYRIFKTIRNSPQYWENQKKEVFAMIRQLGLPTLFLSLSANDLHWSELIIALGKLVDHKDYTEAVQNNSLTWETRSRLVQSDPVTCVRHFDQRVSRFILNSYKKLTKSTGYFGRLLL